MPEPFADVSDLETRWRPLAGVEVAKAHELLGDASGMLRTEAPGIDDRIEQGLLDASIPRQVVCRMVKRAMQGPVDLDGVSSANQQAGPFANQITFANPSGDLYLAKQDRKLLGLSRQRAFTIDTLPPRPDAPEDDGS